MAIPELSPMGLPKTEVLPVFEQAPLFAVELAVGGECTEHGDYQPEEATNIAPSEEEERIALIYQAERTVREAYVPEANATPGVVFFSANNGEATVSDMATDTTVKEIFSGRLRTRTALAEDVAALAHIELRAFRDVYGEEVSREKLAAVETTFGERITLLGDWIKVMEDETGKVAGMMICCPFKAEGDAASIAESNMTSNETLKEAFDPEGDKIYIVNLAVDPDAPKNVRYMLFGRMLSEAVGKGVTHAYLESRLPGLKAWCTQEKGVDPRLASETDMDILAEEYWQSTRKSASGREVPLDPLLRIYTDSGVQPVKLVKEAWTKDNPSAGYGVFGVREIPMPGLILRNRIARRVVGGAIRRASDSNYLMRKVFDRGR